MVHHCSWEHRDGYNDYSTSLPRGDKAESGSSAALCAAWGLLRGLSVSSTPAVSSCGTLGTNRVHSTCAISMIRMGYLDIKEDLTWVNVEPACWSFTELCCGLLCACVPTLRPFVSRYFPSMSSYNRSRKTYATNQPPEPHTANRYHEIELQNGRHIQEDLLQDDGQSTRILCVSEFTVTETRELANTKHGERESDDEVLLVSHVFADPRPIEKARTRPGRLPATD